MFDTRTRLFFFACQNDAAGAALKRRRREKKNQLRLHSKSGGSKRLSNTGCVSTLNVGFKNYRYRYFFNTYLYSIYYNMF